VDARTDVYALGVVMFRMFSGHLPFDAKDKKDLLRHQLFSPVPPISWLTEDVPAELAELIRQATRKHPEERPASMEELSSRLSALRGTQATEHPPESIEWSNYASDVYEPLTDRGRQAMALLAREFGAYSRPHSPHPPKSE